MEEPVWSGTGSEGGVVSDATNLSGVAFKHERMK